MADTGMERFKIGKEAKRATDNGDTKKALQDEKRLILAKKKEGKTFAQRKALFKDLAEKLNSTLLSPDDFAVLSQKYADADIGHDEQIDEDEVKKLFEDIEKCKHEGWYKRYFGDSVDFDGPAASAIYNVIDKDASGGVSQHEFLSWVVTEGKAAAELDQMLAARGFTSGMVFFLKQLFKDAVATATPKSGINNPDEQRLASNKIFKELKMALMKPSTNKASGKAKKKKVEKVDEEDVTTREMFKNELTNDNDEWTSALRMVVDKVLRPYLEDHEGGESPEPEPETEALAEESAAEDGANVFVDTIMYKVREQRRTAARIPPKSAEEFWRSRIVSKDGPPARLQTLFAAIDSVVANSLHSVRVAPPCPLMQRSNNPALLF